MVSTPISIEPLQKRLRTCVRRELCTLCTSVRAFVDEHISKTYWRPQMFFVRSLKRLLLHKVDWGCQNRMNIDDLKHHESRMLCLKFISPLKAHQSHVAHWGTLELLCESFGVLLWVWQIIFWIQSGTSGHVQMLEPTLGEISYPKTFMLFQVLFFFFPQKEHLKDHFHS